MRVSNQFRRWAAAMFAVIGMLAILCAGCGDKGTGSDRDSGGGENPSGTTYTVTFNANGGTGTVPAKQTVNAGTAITLPSGSGLTKSGYTFDGWNTNNSGTGTNYSAGGSYTPTVSVTLYAKWNADSSGGQDDPPEILDVDVLVVDISSETSDWNYVAVGKDGSSMFIDVDESNGMPSRVYIKPDKDSDNGATIFFKENGLPDKMVVGGHILYYGNFTGNKYDVAVIYPDSRIEYHYGVETDVDWDNYIKAAGLSKARGKVLDWIVDWGLPAIGTGITCATAVFVKTDPSLWVNCGVGVVSYASHLTIEAVDAFCKSCDVGPARFLLNGFDCATFFAGDLSSALHVVGMPSGVKACFSFATTLADAIVGQDADITNEKNSQINEANEKIGGGESGGSTVTTYTVTFSVNGGIGTVPARQTVDSGSSIALPSGSGLTWGEGRNEGRQVFVGWSTCTGTGGFYLSGSGPCTDSGTVLSAGSRYTPTASVTLYARWREVYTVWFRSEIGSGKAPDMLKVVDGSSVMLPDQGDLKMSEGYIFDGWNTGSTGKGTSYSAYSSFTPTEDVTLYAQWKWVRGSQFNPNIAYTPFTDNRDGKSYMKVAINRQTWMAENLNYETANSVCYKNSPDSCDKYGRLYLHADALTACPAGWHLPKDDEWTALRDYVGDVMTAGRHLKSQLGWNDCGPSGSGSSYVCADTYGFSAMSGGSAYNVGGVLESFGDVGKIGDWWSATGGSGPTGEADVVWRREMGNNTEILSTPLGKLNDLGMFQFSVRCVAD